MAGSHFTSDEAIGSFAECHLIQRTGLVDREDVAIYWLYTANRLVHEGYSNCSEDTFVKEPTIGLLLNLLDRAGEHVGAAIVNLVTGCPASAEVVARAAMESTVNVSYILDGDKMGRLAAYFRDFFSTTNKSIDKWCKASSRLEREGQKLHLAAADKRRLTITQLETFMQRTLQEMAAVQPIVDQSNWPSIAARFEAVNMQVSYRTVYARMCSQTHGDAEDTLIYFVGMLSGKRELMERMGLETINFSRFLVYCAVSLFIDASVRYAESFGMHRIAQRIGAGKSVVESRLLDMLGEIGAV